MIFKQTNNVLIRLESKTRFITYLIKIIDKIHQQLILYTYYTLYILLFCVTMTIDTLPHSTIVRLERNEMKPSKYTLPKYTTFKV